MKIFYSPKFDRIVETERFDGEYQIDFMDSVVLYVYKYKTIAEAKKAGWFLIGDL